MTEAPERPWSKLDKLAALLDERMDAGASKWETAEAIIAFFEADQPDPVKDAAREKSLAECLSDLCLMARRSRDLINTKVSDLDVITFTATKGQLKAALRALAEQEQSDE